MTRTRGVVQICWHIASLRGTRIGDGQTRSRSNTQVVSLTKWTAWIVELVLVKVTLLFGTVVQALMQSPSLQLASARGPTSNGVHHETPEFLGPRQLINRHEYIRLLEQSLHRLGFAEAAHQLEQDSVRAQYHFFLTVTCCIQPRAFMDSRQ